MRKTTVLLADDHEATLEWVRIALNGNFDVIGAVRNGWDAVTEVRRLDPDVLVIDISMPKMNGLQAVSLLAERDFISAAFAVGASAYVVKSDLHTDLVPAIRHAVDGQRYVSRSIRAT